MAYVKIGELLEKIGSAFKLVLVASRRSNELNSGAPGMVKIDSPKISSVAIEEIRRGLIGYKKRATKK